MAGLLELLKRGVEACSSQGEVWTQPRVTALIQAEFGVTYHPAHVGRLLKRLGWSRQQPVVRASQRDLGDPEKKPSGKDTP